MSALLFPSETQPRESVFLLLSLSDGAKFVGASSFLFALIFTSLQTSVWASKINLFKDAALPGFKRWVAEEAEAEHR